MRSTIHMNLLDHSERKGSNPVRFRVLAPAISILVLAVLLLRVAAADSKVKWLGKTKDEIQGKIAGLQEGVKMFVEMTARKNAADSSVKQLETYMGSRLLFGEALEALPGVVPPTVQFTSLEILKPMRPVEKKAAPGAPKPPVAANVKIAEKVDLRICGFADSSDSVESLKNAVQSGPFTNLVLRAVLPAGSFRLATGRDAPAAGVDMFMFELKCDCRERVFE